MGKVGPATSVVWTIAVNILFLNTFMGPLYKGKNILPLILLIPKHDLCIQYDES